MLYFEQLCVPKTMIDFHEPPLKLLVPKATQTNDEFEKVNLVHIMNVPTHALWPRSKRMADLGLLALLNGNLLDQELLKRDVEMSLDM